MITTGKRGDKTAQYIMTAMALGLAGGLVIHHFEAQHYALYAKPISDIFLRLLQMIIVPLLFSSIYMAMIGLGSPKNLGDMGKKAIGYYFITTCVAVLIGLTLVNIFQPGVGADLSHSGVMPEKMAVSVSQNQGLFQTMLGMLINAIPTNPFQAMAEANILQIIVFSMLIGVVALFFQEQSQPITKAIKSLESITMGLIHGIMKIAPLGLGVLMMNTVASSGTSAIKSLGQYMLVVIVGLLIHGLLLLIVGAIRGRMSPFSLLRGVSTPLLTAFSTCSSAATLPLSMASVQDNLATNKQTSEFVLPLGATINMDGTALYESVAVIFIAQAYGIELSLANQVIVFFTCSLAAVGAAAIPGAGLITMGIVLNAVGLPLDGIGLILAVDRILDQFRTMVNVLGDCVGVLVVDSMLNKK